MARQFSSYPRSFTKILTDTLSQQLQQGIKGFGEQSEQKAITDYYRQQTGATPEQAKAFGRLPKDLQRIELQQRAKAQPKQQADQALAGALREAGWADDAISRHIAMDKDGRKADIESRKVHRSQFRKFFQGEAPHPMASVSQSQYTPDNINKVVQQLKEEGMADEEIIETVKNEMEKEQQEQQEEQQPLSALRGFGGAATGALGGAALKGLQTFAPAAAAPMVAHSVANLGTGVINEILNAFGQGRPLPTVLEKVQQFQDIGTRALEDVEKMAADIVEKKTGKRPDIKIEKAEPPLKSLLPYTSIGGIGQGLRDMAKTFGYDIDPKTEEEKKLTDVGEAIALFFNPETAAAQGIKSALKIAGIQGSAPALVGYLAKKLTGSEVIDKGVTLGGYVLAQRYPGAIDKFKKAEFKKWDDALKKEGTKVNIKANPIDDKVIAIEKELNIGAPHTPAKDLIRKDVLDPIKSAQKDVTYKLKKVIQPGVKKVAPQAEPVPHTGKYSAQDLNDLYRTLNKKELQRDVVKHQVKDTWGKAKDAVSDAIDKWGKANAPDALKGFRTGNSIASAQFNTSAIADAIRRAAGGGMVSVNPYRLALKLVAKPTANIMEEFSQLFRYPGIRSAYYNLLEAGAKNNPEVIINSTNKLAAAVKKQNRSLYEKLTKK